MSSWSATQYLAFEAERTRPVRDLLSALPTPAELAARMIDIGCGPGNSTELLARRYPDAAVTGIDGSADMIAAARARLAHVSFRIETIEHWLEDGLTDAAPASRATARGYDVILANAVLQWLPDHATLFPALIRKLARGGALAVQMPDNFQEPAHVLMRDIAGRGPWAAKLAGVVAGRGSIMEAQWYHGLLRSTGCAVDVWRTTYHHLLAGGADAVVEWFKGTGLRPFLAPLDADERSAFLAQYREAVAGAYPATPDGAVLLPFPRLFIVAVR